MSYLENMFTIKAEAVKNLSSKPTDEELLQLYGLYKQAIIGDNNTKCPSFYRLQERAKWRAWNDNVGVLKDTAKQRYIDLVDKLESKYGTK